MSKRIALVLSALCLSAAALTSATAAEPRKIVVEMFGATW
jgi:hypothetical protein